ncbi:hypothetical protein [Gardnerella sp. KA00747]|uniref:hypothetical protein n=1 Tax=Gardnerella sp. KA00747 TaxID=2749078 RepID=UPI003BA8ACDF
MFQKMAKTLARIATRSLTKLALKVPRTSNLSEFPLRIAFARYALSASAGRRANSGEKTPANVHVALQLCSADVEYLLISEL